jgi:Cdc6-like AAA superfamily ATPase
LYFFLEKMPPKVSSKLKVKSKAVSKAIAKPPSPAPSPRSARLNRLRQVLSVLTSDLTSNTTGPLPGRGAESAVVEEFVKQVRSGEPREVNLLVVGAPGTGKTATVRSVTRSLTGLPVQEVNCMSFDRPDVDIWHALRQALRLEPCRLSSIADFRACVEEVKEEVSKRKILIVVDECDQIVTGSSRAPTLANTTPVRGRPAAAQRALTPSRIVGGDTSLSGYFSKFKYLSLSEVLALKGPGFGIIALANTVDLAVHIRGEVQLEVFSSYSVDQLREILMCKIKVALGEDDSVLYSTITKEALELCVRKIAANHGDARKMLDICKYVVEPLPLHFTTFQADCAVPDGFGQ